MATSSTGQHILLVAPAILLGWLLSAAPVAASVDAAIGKTWPIAERDFLEVIQAKLAAKQESGELARWQQAMTTQALHTLKHPTPVPGISRASQTETRYYDPSVTATHDSHDADGKLVVKAGTRANPLDYLGFSKVLLFIDARDPQQTAYAEQYYRDSRKPVKVVLVGGSWLELMRQWQRPVFYDQGGSLSSRLAITRVPALVYQESPDARELRIDSIALPEAGNGASR